MAGDRPEFMEARAFLEDGDVVTLRATAPGRLGNRLALGEVTGRIEPSITAG